MSSSTILSMPAARQRFFGSPLRIGLTVVGTLFLLLLVAAGYLVWRMTYVPPDLDFSTTRLSEAGIYSASFAADTQPVPVNKLHTWRLHVVDADGAPITDAAIRVDGDMPQHGHGMPTRPEVTQNLGGGDYLVEGMKFQMGGWWVIDFYVMSPAGEDKVSFNLMLQE